MCCDYYVSAVATVTTHDAGQRIGIATVPGTECTMLIADTKSKPVSIVGSIEFMRNGSMHLSDLPNNRSAVDLTWLPLNRVATIIGIIGFRSPATFNVCDLGSFDEDIIRLKKGETKLFIPAKYKVPTAAYDECPIDKVVIKV